MAAAYVQPSPRSLVAAQNYRIPLSNNPNAANSPFRGLVPVSGKRTRAQVEITKESVLGQPPQKRQVVDLTQDENTNAAARAFTRQSQGQREAESRLFLKASGSVTALDKKFMAAKQTKPAPPPQSPDRPRRTDEGLDNIRQWQKHYRKAFPTFVFYFDAIPEDSRQKMSRLCLSLGAKEAKFFSKDVTHLITTRSNAQAKHGDYGHDAARDHPQQRTIDPSLLDRRDTAHAGALRRTTDLLDSTLQSRMQQASAHHSTDIVTKARELGIKIWALEKLQRMMNTMYNTETGEQPSQHLARSHATADLAQKTNQADLQRMIQKEKATGTSSREVNPVTEWASFRGYYIYVHDMNEVLRPIMIRDYPKSSKDGGKWPQFKQSAVGRCPFIEDPHYLRRLAEEEKRAEAAANSKAKTRSAADASKHAALTERHENRRESPRKATEVRPLHPPKVPDGVQPLFNSAQAKLRTQARYIGGEPVASGVQPSNVTSAIRSQIISSTAISSTAPGGRIGASRELHALKRKVLERGVAVTSGQTLTSSYMNDVRAALNGDNAKSSKRKAEALGNIQEDEEDEPRPRKIHQTRRVKAMPPRDPKPGFCENCRDKYDDFDEHILSRNHRKFALTASNWTQLDQLLSQLKRPLKQR